MYSASVCNRQEFRLLLVLSVVLVSGAVSSQLWAAGAPNSEQTIQDVLKDYRITIEKTFKKYPRDEQKKVRNELLLAAKKKYNKERKTAAIPKTTISRNFEKLQENITTIRTSFRTIKEQKIKNLWLQEATRVFTDEVKAATDFKTKEHAQRWFENFLDMMFQLRNALRFDEHLGRAIYPIISQVFNLVIKEMPKKKSFGSPDEQYEANLRLVRAKFPVKTAELKKQNDALRRLMEQHALTVFRRENQ